MNVCVLQKPNLSSTTTNYDRHFIVALLRKCLFNAKPKLLLQFAQLITDIANGKVVADLDCTIGGLLDSAELDYNSLGSTETDESSLKGNNHSHCTTVSTDNGTEITVLHNDDAPTTAVLSTAAAAAAAAGGGAGAGAANANTNTATPTTAYITNTTNGMDNTNSKTIVQMPQLEDADSVEGCTRKQTEETSQTTKAELAKQHLNSGKGKLQKQRTLEKIRYATEDENLDGSEENQGELEGLEKNICTIVAGVVQWIKDHSDKSASEDLMVELRNTIMETTSKVCFENAPKATYENQLSTIVDNALSPYFGEKIGTIRQQLVTDISEILYNELAFFQLMQSIDNLVYDDGPEPHS